MKLKVTVKFIFISIFFMSCATTVDVNNQKSSSNGASVGSISAEDAEECNSYRSWQSDYWKDKNYRRCIYCNIYMMDLNCDLSENPVNYYNLKNPKKDMMKIAIAGPASNLILAFIVLFLAEFFNLNDYYKIIIPLYWINIALAVFNMLPISPLDGSQIFNPIISSFDKNLAYKLNRNGPYLLLFIILVSTIFNYPILSIIMNPIISFITSILIFIISWII